MSANEQQPTALAGRLAVVAILVLGVSLATIATLGRPRISIRPQSTQAFPSLLLLAFESLNAEPDGERLARDITVELGARLEAAGTEETGFAFVGVREFRYREGGMDADVRAYASSAGVDYVLAGSVVLDLEGIVVDAFMVQPGREPRIWAQSERFPLAGDDLPVEKQAVDRILGALNTRRGPPSDSPRPFVP